MNREQSEEAKRLLVEIRGELQRPDLDAQQRAVLEQHQAALAGVMLSPWLPVGWCRRLLMALFLTLGFLAWVFEWHPLWWSVALLAVAISPRLMGKVFFYAGRFAAGRERR
jgi:hypothetical protein